MITTAFWYIFFSQKEQSQIEYQVKVNDFSVRAYSLKQTYTRVRINQYFDTFFKKSDTFLQMHNGDNSYSVMSHQQTFAMQIRLDPDYF